MNRCQIYCVGGIAAGVGAFESLWQKKNRLKRIFRRRLNYMLNMLSEAKARRTEALSARDEASNGFNPGDRVEVRSREEIKATLNRWGQLKGCAFMEEMLPYCGTTHRVFKRVERFLDERDYLVKRSKGIVILEGVYCGGTKDYGPCDRGCFFFWREEWLKKGV